MVVMKNFEFKSQICTTKEQSERLLALGLKKETADMTIVKFGEYYCEFVGKVEISCGTIRMNWEEIDNSVKEYIPAWSLDRLIEMINLKIQFRLKEKTTVLYGVSHSQPFQSFSGFGIDSKSYYNSIINAIEWLIKEGYFNKDYLQNEIK